MMVMTMTTMIYTMTICLGVSHVLCPLSWVSAGIPAGGQHPDGHAERGVQGRPRGGGQGQGGQGRKRGPWGARGGQGQGQRCVAMCVCVCLWWEGGGGGAKPWGVETS